MAKRGRPRKKRTAILVKAPKMCVVRGCDNGVADRADELCRVCRHRLQSGGFSALSHITLTPPPVVTSETSKLRDQCGMLISMLSKVISAEYGSDPD